MLDWNGRQQDAAHRVCGFKRQQTLLFSTPCARCGCRVTSVQRGRFLHIPSFSIRSKLAVRTNSHRSTARAHVQPQAGCCFGFCSGLAPFGSFAAALTAKSGRALPTCAASLPRRAAWVAFRTLTIFDRTRCRYGWIAKLPMALRTIRSRSPSEWHLGWKIYPPPRTSAGYDR